MHKRHISLKECIDRYIESRKEASLADQTLSNYSSRLQLFLQWAGEDKKANEITAADVQNYFTNLEDVRYLKISSRATEINRG